MACVIRRHPLHKYPFWIACFTDALGRRLKRSTGLTSKSKAQRFADGLQRAADEARGRTLTEDRARKIISEIVASVHGGEGLRTYTVAQWFDHVCKIKAKSRGAGTAERYNQIRNEFLDFLGRKQNLNILSITSADVRRFRDQRENRLCASTVNDRQTILSAFFYAAWRDGIISNNPCTAVEPVRDNLSPAKRRKQPYTLEQIVALLKAAEGTDWAGLIRCAFYTGARLENLKNLRFRDLDFASDPPVIVFEKYAKHGDEHRVPMHPALRDYLAGLSTTTRHGKVIELPAAKRDAPLFPSLAGQRVANLSKHFRKLMEKAGIENRKVREIGHGASRDVWALGFHSFRRTNISILANRGVSEEKRMTLVAHSSRDVHKIYTSHEIKQLSEAVATLPSL
jgi:integrase